MHFVILGLIHLPYLKQKRRTEDFSSALLTMLRYRAVPKRSIDHRPAEYEFTAGYTRSIATATSRATFIMVVKAVWRSSAEVSTPFRTWSEMVQMQRPLLP